MREATGYKIFEAIVLILFLPIFLLYWLSVGILYVQGRINALKLELEEEYKNQILTNRDK